jgi:hypothetical protein
MSGFAVHIPPEATPNESGGDEARLARRALVTLDLVFFLTMSALVLRAPCGAWENRTFGIPFWNNLDPGGPYVISSVHFFDPGYPPFRTGHPGTTLQFILWIAARTAHRVATLWSQLPFVEFWARHIGWLLALSSAVVAALHVVSFHALYAYARHIGLRATTALIAVLAYATSFPVLYYGGRVSPEPLLVTFTLSALLLAGSSARALRQGRFIRASALAAGAGTASVLAVLSKLHLAYALPAVVLAQVLLQRWDLGQPRIERARNGLLPTAAFVAASIAVFVIGSLKVDWHAFFEFWLHYTPGRAAGDPGLPLAQRYWALLPSMARVVLVDAPRNLSSHLGWTPNGIFTLSEGLFLLVACTGLVRLWRRHPSVRRNLVWPAALCAGLLPVVAYRAVWHYYILYMVFATLGFAYAVESWLGPHTGTRPASGSGRFGRRVVATVLTHLLALVFFTATKVHDIAAFRSQVRPYLTALEGLPSGMRAAIVSRHFEFSLIDGGFPNYIDREHVGLTQLEEQRARVVKRADLITPELVDRLKIATVIDATSGAPRAISIERWLATPRMNP